MLNFIKNFAAKDDGAVTVDWIVLTAALVAIAIGVLTVVRTGTATLTTQIETDLATAAGE